MALLTALLSLVARQLSTIMQAIFGWSVTALFGKLASRMQTALSVALLLSVAWPFLVLGCFFPSVAAWAVAMVPLHKWASAFVLRIVWATLAVLVPIAVGAISYWIAPTAKLRGGLLFTLVGGYPMTLGYALAFIVTAITVPIVKLLSAVHRWEDSHVYVEAKEGREGEVLDALREACRRAGVSVAQEDVPRPMALATSLLRGLAGRFVVPTTGARPQRLRGAQLELYLYPADLLLRGDPHRVARVRAAMTQTDLEACAYLVASADAKRIQDEVGRVPPAELARELEHAPISFEEWTVLETFLRRPSALASRAA